MPKPAVHDIGKLGSEMLRFAAQIHAYRSPDEVLDSLHKVTLAACNISVLVAGLLPLRWGDWSGFEKGKTVFLTRAHPKAGGRSGLSSAECIQIQASRWRGCRLPLHKVRNDDDAPAARH